MWTHNLFTDYSKMWTHNLFTDYRNFMYDAYQINEVKNKKPVLTLVSRSSPVSRTLADEESFLGHFSTHLERDF